MYLKHLTINGFKSFAKKGELEFSAPITAIVGPNGSGKSNVAESFRFVLGEQSVKSMRGKRGEDLIWGGTDQVSRGNRASVAVVLDNSTKVFPVDFQEITLERVVHRDGQNEYLINGSKVRLKDVQEILAAANIGSTGHHIISQGEADRILSAAPSARRAMIEDALGLKVYQYKKQDAEKKLQKTRENIERVESLRREVAPHLKFLERQIKKIARSIALREELTSFYQEYLRREDTYLAHHYDRLTAARQEPAGKLEELKIALIAAKETLAAAEENTERTELVAAEEAVAKVRAERQVLLKELGSLEGQMSFLTRRIAAEEAKQQSHAGQPIPYAEVEKIIATVESEVERAVKRDDSSLLQRALTDVVHTLKRWLQKSTEVDFTSTEAEKSEFDALQKTKAETETKLNQLEATEAAAETKYNDIKAAIEAEASESREAERQMFAIVNEQRECENTLARIDAELAAIERDRNEFKRELQEAVALIGRGTAQYFSYEIVADGKKVSVGAVVEEDRDKQRERRRELEKMKIRLEELGGANEDIEKEYKEVKERDDFLASEIIDLTTSVEKLGALIADLNDQLNERFVAGIEKISAEFNKFFTLMFGGGSAELQQVISKPRKKVSEDEFDEEGLSASVSEDEIEETVAGIDLSVKLPNKRVKGLEMLSGGERALTSIALIFAMSQVNPPLFIILDETDAALDEANSRRYGDMIEALAQKSQLILITHNRETMSRAGILYGVTMGADGVSKLLSVKFDEALAVAK